MPSLPSSLALTTIATNAQILSADHRNNYTAIQTAVNALITDLSGGSAGQFLTATSSSAIAYAGGYTDYSGSLTWASSGTAPSLGNATVTAHYLQIGKLVHYWARIVFGSTTTFGTGTYTFSLPVTAAASAVLANGTLGPVQLFDSSATALGIGGSIWSTSTVFAPVIAATYLGTLTQVSQTAPWTWAQNDVITWNLFYEAA